MKFGGFKFGKSKDKENIREEAITQADEELVPEIPLDEVTPVEPHAPLQELSLDNIEEDQNGSAITLDENTAVEEAGEPIKLVEFQASPPTRPVEQPINAPPPPAQTPPVQAAPSTVKDNSSKDDLDLATSISNIFNNIEDEENPLASLIKALPDVAATELIDDLKEINDIIKDWQKK